MGIRKGGREVRGGTEKREEDGRIGGREGRREGGRVRRKRIKRTGNEMLELVGKGICGNGKKGRRK